MLMLCFLNKESLMPTNALVFFMFNYCVID